MSDDLAVVLHWLNDDLRRLDQQADADLRAARANARDLDGLEARVARLAARAGIEVVGRTQAPDLAGAGGVSAAPVAPPPWADVVAAASQRLEARGVAVGRLDLDGLLDPEAISRIERRFSGSFRVEAQLDRYDIMATVAAGLVAALVDLLIVRLPTDVTYLGEHLQRGSPLTGWLRSLDVPSDNQLARWFKVSFDKVRDVPVSGFHPRSHRLQTFGHDPLVGLVVGVIDIMRGGLTAIGRDGQIVILDGTGEPVYNPFKAVVYEIGHLLSDAPTKMGIPAPGWSLLQLMQFGSFGEKERTVADLARFMYLKGYDSRHFLTMGTSVAAAEVVLRGYFWLRRKMDDQYEADCDRQAHVAGARRTGDHPRFITMALGAHGIAAAANAGKVGFAHAGNPLAINYAQWLRFLQSLYKWYQMKMQSPTDLLIRQGQWNQRMLETGWPDIGIDDDGFPELSG